MQSHHTQHKITASGVRSLIWEGDSLIDWVSGGARYSLDGSTESRDFEYDDKFDSAISSPSGHYVVLYARTGTAGVLLHRGEIVRHLSRDPYQADVYEYPITFATSSNGQELLVHCPDSYCQIVVEDAATGAKVTSQSMQSPGDIFHSRLSSSSNARWLLSAGWVWHPVDVVNVLDFTAALENSVFLDNKFFSPPSPQELSCAAFVNDEFIVVGSSEKAYGKEKEGEGQSVG